MRLKIVAGAFSLLLMAELYLFAATASIDDSYQPGINSFRQPFIPELWLLVVVGIPLLLSFLSPWRAAALRSASTLAGAGLFAALATFALLVAIDKRQPCIVEPPSTRTLETTLRHSLLCPQLSNRSYAAPLYTALLSGGLLWLACVRRPNPKQPAA